MAKSLDDNIQALSRTVLEEAQSKAEQILAEARVKAESARQRASEQASIERRGILERASREAERIHSQAVAAAQLKMRTQLLIHREKLIEDVFESVRQKLASFPQRDDYSQIAAQMLREALQRLNADTAQIHSDPRTGQILSGNITSQICNELHIKVQSGQPLNQELGVIVETPDRHRRFDNTFQTRLNRLQNSLRARVYDILTGK